MPRYICAYRNECSGVNTQVIILFFLTPKSDVAYIFEDETLRQTLEKMEHRKFSCIPLLSLDGKYKGTISEGDLLWGMKTLNVPNLKAAEGHFNHGYPTQGNLQSSSPQTPIWRICLIRPLTRIMFRLSMIRDTLSVSLPVKRSSNIATKNLRNM